MTEAKHTWPAADWNELCRWTNETIAALRPTGQVKVAYTVSGVKEERLSRPAPREKNEKRRQATKVEAKGSSKATTSW